GSWAERIGPYRKYEAAADALERAKERNEEWERQNAEGGGEEEYRPAGRRLGRNEEHAMRHGMRRLGGAAGIALAATLAIAPAASATTDDGEDHKPAKPAGVVLAPHPLVGVRIAIDPGHSAAGNSRADAQSADAKVPDGRGGRTECT